MKHKLLNSMIASLLLSGSLYAATDPAAKAQRVKAVQSPATGSTQQEEAPAVLLEQGMDKLQAFLSQEPQPDKKALAGFLDKEIAPFFDFAYMTKSSAGPVYRHMEQDQRERMTDNIKQQFLASMSERLAGYSSQKLRVLSQRYGRRGFTATVTVAVLQPRSYPARLDFRLYRTKTGWKVFDVSANGQSAVIHYRRQFRRMMYSTRFERQGFDGQQQMRRSFRHPTSQ